MPVPTVIDFRQEEEKAGKVNKTVEGAQYISLPIDASGNAAASATEEEKKKFTGRKKFDVKKIIVMAAFNDKAKAVARNMYPVLLFSPECQSQFAEFFRLVLRAESGAVLYHCTQGKDRTGIGAAFVLSALGADRETIIADFDLSNRQYAPIVNELCAQVQAQGGGEDEMDVVRAFMGVSTRNFRAALAMIDERWGSMDNYLEQCLGINSQDRMLLQSRYLQ